MWGPPRPEWEWRRDSSYQVLGPINLTSDREVRGLWLEESISGKERGNVNLNNKLLTIGNVGINFIYSGHGASLHSGHITSSEAYLKISAHTSHSSDKDSDGNFIIYFAHINAVIQDHKNHKIGLFLTGTHPAGERGTVRLGGDKSNTFTGDVIVDGEMNILSLQKQNGATAIKGNSYVRNGGRLAIANSNQIADSATVTLSGNGKLTFTNEPLDVSEKIHALRINDGVGVFNFIHNSNPDARKMLFLDDLIIAQNASLRITEWKAGRDYFLVRKDSRYLDEALKRISIDGWAKNQIYLKSYNKDYWSIEAAPEPATYGAIFGVLGMGLVLFYHRRRSSRICGGRTG